MDGMEDASRDDGASKRQRYLRVCWHCQNQFILELADGTIDVFLVHYTASDAGARRLPIPV